MDRTLMKSHDLEINEDQKGRRRQVHLRQSPSHRVTAVIKLEKDFDVLIRDGSPVAPTT